MGRVRSITLSCAGVAPLLLLLAAAQQPQALGQVSAGLWEMSGLPGSTEPLRQCFADTGLLAQVEHRNQTCTRVVISDAPDAAVVHYTCAKGGFGQTKVTVLTPRSLRIETQGISAKLPFNYVIQARRVGTCDVH